MKKKQLEEYQIYELKPMKGITLPMNSYKKFYSQYVYSIPGTNNNFQYMKEPYNKAVAGYENPQWLPPKELKNLSAFNADKGLASHPDAKRIELVKNGIWLGDEDHVQWYNDEVVKRLELKKKREMKVKVEVEDEVEAEVDDEEVDEEVDEVVVEVDVDDEEDDFDKFIKAQSQIQKIEGSIEKLKRMQAAIIGKIRDLEEEVGELKQMVKYKNSQGTPEFPFEERLPAETEKESEKEYASISEDDLSELEELGLISRPTSTSRETMKIPKKRKRSELTVQTNQSSDKSFFQRILGPFSNKQ